MKVQTLSVSSSTALGAFARDIEIWSASSNCCFSASASPRGTFTTVVTIYCPLPSRATKGASASSPIVKHWAALMGRKSRRKRLSKGAKACGAKPNFAASCAVCWRSAVPFSCTKAFHRARRAVCSPADARYGATLCTVAPFTFRIMGAIVLSFCSRSASAVSSVRAR